MKKRTREFILAFVMSFVIAILLGFGLLIYENTQYSEVYLKSKFEIMVFINKNEAAPEVVGEKIRSINLVKSVVFVSKEKIKEKMSKFNDEIYIAESANPFPDAFSLSITEINSDKARDLSAILKTIPSIDEVIYDSNLLKIISEIKTVKGMMSSFLAGILAVLALVLVAMLLVDFRNIKMLKKIIDDESFFVNMASGIAGVVSALFISFVVVLGVGKIGAQRIYNYSFGSLLYAFVFVLIVLMIKTLAERKY